MPPQKTSSFMKHALLMIVLQLASSGADAYYTHHSIAVSTRFSEHNPVARPFVYSTSGQIGYFSATAGIKIAVPFALRRQHHAKLAEAFAIAGIADNASCAAFTATHIERTPAK